MSTIPAINPHLHIAEAASGSLFVSDDPYTGRNKISGCVKPLLFEVLSQQDRRSSPNNSRRQPWRAGEVMRVGLRWPECSRRGPAFGRSLMPPPFRCALDCVLHAVHRPSSLSVDATGRRRHGERVSVNGDGSSSFSSAASEPMNCACSHSAAGSSPGDGLPQQRQPDAEHPPSRETGTAGVPPGVRLYRRTPPRGPHLQPQKLDKG